MMIRRLKGGRNGRDEGLLSNGAKLTTLVISIASPTGSLPTGASQTGSLPTGASPTGSFLSRLRPQSRFFSRSLSSTTSSSSEPASPNDILLPLTSLAGEYPRVSIGSESGADLSEVLREGCSRFFATYDPKVRLEEDPISSWLTQSIPDGRNFKIDEFESVEDIPRGAVVSFEPMVQDAYTEMPEFEEGEREIPGVTYDPATPGLTQMDLYKNWRRRGQKHTTFVTIPDEPQRRPSWALDGMEGDGLEAMKTSMAQELAVLMGSAVQKEETIMFKDTRKRFAQMMTDMRGQVDKAKTAVQSVADATAPSKLWKRATEAVTAAPKATAPKVFRPMTPLAVMFEVCRMDPVILGADEPRLTENPMSGDFLNLLHASYFFARHDQGHHYGNILRAIRAHPTVPEPPIGELIVSDRLMLVDTRYDGSSVFSSVINAMQIPMASEELQILFTAWVADPMIREWMRERFDNSPEAAERDEIIATQNVTSGRTPLGFPVPDLSALTHFCRHYNRNFVIIRENPQGVLRIASTPSKLKPDTPVGIIIVCRKHAANLYPCGQPRILAGNLPQVMSHLRKEWRRISSHIISKKESYKFEDDGTPFVTTNECTIQ